MGETDRDQSEFNMAVSYLNRLNNLFYYINEARMTKDLDAWLQGLISLYQELVTEMKDKEVDEYWGRLMKIYPQVENHSRLLMTKGSAPISKQVYEELNRIEIALRKIMKQAGLLLKQQKDPRFALQ